MRVRLLTNQLKSQSLKRVAEGLSTALGYKVWRSSNHKPNTKEFLYGDQRDKLYQYSWFGNNNINSLEFTTEIEVAKHWAKTGTVVCRKLLNASEGKGIVVSEAPNEVVQAPVYTKYIPKKKEFRVHIFKDNIVSVVEKRRSSENYSGESKIRNTANGYVFCHQNVVEPEGIRELALAARKVTNSDFAGVDIGYNVKHNKLFVIEVNSAPGIEGSNVDKYVEAIVNA